MPNYELCIDLGSNFTTIYKKGSGVVLHEPTVVLLSNASKSKRIVAFGHEAQINFGKLKQNEILVKPVIEGIIKNVDLTKKLIGYFFSKIVKYSLVKPFIELIVCMPLSLTEEQYEDYRSIFYSIGFGKISFVCGQICASLNDSPYSTIGKASLFVDIGAGKTEIASIVNGKILNACSLNVGGNLVDNKIVEYLQKTRGCVVSTNTANKIKHEIGSLFETDNSCMEVLVQDLQTNMPVSTIVYSQELSNPICESYFKILQTIQVFLNSCSPEVVQDVKNSGIVFIGGGSLIAGIEKFFKKLLKINVFVMDSPEVFKIMGSEKLFLQPMLLKQIEEENWFLCFFVDW